MMTERRGFEFTQEWLTGDEDIFSDEALDFLAALFDRFAGRRGALLAKRRDWQAGYDAGRLPDFRPETAEIRQGDWRVAPLPAPLLDRRVEITGPVDRKMIINALNADVKVFMADFEDALSPTWRNVVEGQRNLRDAVRRDIAFTDEKSGKSYALENDPAVLIARVRGLHLDEKHVRRNGEKVPGALVDFALYYHHNHKALIDLGHGPYFYLPKLEHHEEAAWWNDVFAFAQRRYDRPLGEIKATVLVETLPAVFEMHEILHALRDHAAGLNCGRWDYIFSYIKTLKAHPDRMLPDRQIVSMDKPFLDAYSRLLVQTCHRRGALAMGGMSAFLPAKTEEANAENREKVRIDKQREADNGHDGSWIAHPALSDVVNAVYSGAFRPGETNQLAKTREGETVTQAELLAPAAGACTDAGLRANIRVALQYVEAWLQGSGAVAIYGLMEDAATAEISRASIWQWIKHGAILEDGRRMSADDFETCLEEEAAVVRGEVGDDVWSAGRFEEAKGMLKELCLQEDFAEFLTLGAYERI